MSEDNKRDRSLDGTLRKSYAEESADRQRGEGLELNQVPLEGFNYNPAILSNVDNDLYQAWVSIVNSYWTLLIR